MNKFSIYIIMGILSCQWILSDCAQILFLTPLGSKSHKIFFMGVANALAEKGHQVTMVSGFQGAEETKNIREIVLPIKDFSVMLSNVFEEGGSTSLIKDFLMDSPRLCVEALSTKEVQDLKKETFDLVIMSIFFENCFLSLVHHFQVPFIYASPAGLVGSFSETIGNVDFPALVPNKIMAATFPLTFLERGMSLGLTLLYNSAMSMYVEPRMEYLCREKGLCPSDMPPFIDMKKNVSLAIINSVKTLEWPPRPMMPNIIYAGGAHIRPAKNLSKELESWIETSGDDGFIFFSLGSAVTPSFLPGKFRKILINVFGSLKQKVLWKWNEETMSDLPKNVKLGKWFPQQDILGHSKLKLFITHGGLLSTLEATYHGVPIIGMPVFGDQFSNMIEAEGEGWAKLVQWNQLTESFLKVAILETIQNQKLREISLQRSLVMQDRPMNPADEAAFWVEYVLRHNGAHHLMSPINSLSWRELYNMDIWAIIAGTILGFVYLLYRFVKTLLCYCFKSKKRIKTKNE